MFERELRERSHKISDKILNEVADEFDLIKGTVTSDNIDTQSRQNEKRELKRKLSELKKKLKRIKNIRNLSATARRVNTKNSETRKKIRKEIDLIKIRLGEIDRET